MEKVTIKVRIDEALSFNMDIPIEMDILEFSAIVERAKTISKASGATMVAGLKRGPKPAVEGIQEPAPATRKYMTRDKATEMELYHDYLKTPVEDRMAIVGNKYGLHTEGSLVQTFYKIKKKYKLGGSGSRKGRKGIHRVFDQGIKEKIASLYEDGGTAGTISKAMDLNRDQINSQIRYMKKTGKIKRKSKYHRSSVTVTVPKKGNKVDSILGDIFTGKKKKREVVFKGKGHRITNAQRKDIIKRWNKDISPVAHDILAQELGTTRLNLGKTISNWRTVRGLKV